jgi:hypothetical protein
MNVETGDQMVTDNCSIGLGKENTGYYFSSVERLLPRAYLSLASRHQQATLKREDVAHGRSNQHHPKNSADGDDH